MMDTPQAATSAAVLQKRERLPLVATHSLMSWRLDKQTRQAAQQLLGALAFEDEDDQAVLLSER